MKTRWNKWISCALISALAISPVIKYQPVYAEHERPFLHLTSQELPGTTLSQHQIDYLTEQFYKAFESGESQIQILYEWMDGATRENSLSYEEALQTSDYDSIYNLFQSIILTDDRGILIKRDFLQSQTKNIAGISNMIVSLEIFPMETELSYAEEYTEMQKELDAIQQKASSYRSPFSKTWFYHDYLVNLISYDMENADAFDEIGIIAHSAYGGLKKHSCVCSGYAQLYSYFLNRENIQCYTVTSDEIDHEWNVIKFGKDWYFVDATWDDTYHNRQEFLKSASKFEETGHGTGIWELPNGTDIRLIAEREETLGDVNGDGEVSQNDIVYMYRYLTLVFDGMPKHMINGDMDGDGIIDVFDLALLKQKLYLRTTDMY